MAAAVGLLGMDMGGIHVGMGNGLNAPVYSNSRAVEMHRMRMRRQTSPNSPPTWPTSHGVWHGSHGQGQCGFADACEVSRRRHFLA